VKIIFFPRYTEKGPSSRYRIYHYLPLLPYSDSKVYPFFDESYVPAQSLKNLKSIFYVLKRYVIRFNHMLRIKRSDLVFLQYEFTPYLIFNTWYFRFKKVSYIVDYDDAVFHDYDQHKNLFIRNLLKHKIANVITNAKAVITGSPYLTEYAQKFNNNVIEIPTSIDLEKYNIDTNKVSSETLTIGWIGSSTTSFHLKKVVEALHFLREHQIKFKLRLIGYDKRAHIDFKDLPVKVIKWDKDTEIEELDKFDVGIMPLIDYPFAHGKCAFKLIQYMAMAKPTISSPFAANKKVDRNNENLFADSTEEWVNAFIDIVKNRTKYKNIGLRNREVIKTYYSIQSNLFKYIDIIKATQN